MRIRESNVATGFGAGFEPLPRERDLVRESEVRLEKEDNVRRATEALAREQFKRKLAATRKTAEKKDIEKRAAAPWSEEFE
jgi:hypothetical protein